MAFLTNRQLIEQVCDVIVYELGGINPLALTADAPLDDFRMDSLDRIQLIMSLEKEFDINIEDQEAAGLRTVGDVERLIAAKLGVPYEEAR